MVSPPPGIDDRGFGFGGTGKKSFARQFEDYGEAFGLNDTLGCYADLDKGVIAWRCARPLPLVSGRFPAAAWLALSASFKPAAPPPPWLAKTENTWATPTPSRTSSRARRCSLP